MSNYIKAGVSCDASHDNTINKRLKFIFDYLEHPKELNVLDIGSGLGMYSKYLSPHVKQYVGVDTNKEYVDKAKKENRNSNVEFHLMSADKLSFENSSFDVVLMIEVLEHVVDDKKTIVEINRVLKTGGKFIVTAPNKLFPFETHGLRIGNKIYGSSGFGFPFIPWLPEFLRRYLANAKVYTPHGLKTILVRNGFLICNTNFIGPSLDVLSNKFPRLGFITENIIHIFNKVENIPLINNTLTTIIVMSKKVEK